MKKINDILNEQKLGELSFPNMMNAYGETANHVWVWLPQPENDHWINRYLESDEIIVQKGKKENDFQKQAADLNHHVTVIFRNENDDPRLPGEYRTVFHNENPCLIIHARDTLPMAQGNILTSTDNTIEWVSGFAATAEEAIENAEKYKKKAGL